MEEGNFLGCGRSGVLEINWVFFLIASSTTLFFVSHSSSVEPCLFSFLFSVYTFSFFSSSFLSHFCWLLPFTVLKIFLMRRSRLPEKHAGLWPRPAFRTTWLPQLTDSSHCVSLKSGVDKAARHTQTCETSCFAARVNHGYT